MSRLRWWAAGVVAGLAALALAVAGPAAAGPVASSGARAAARPDARLDAASCPAPNYPHGADTNPYELTFTGTIASSISITGTPVGSINLPAVDGNFCGALELPLQQADVPPDSLHLNRIPSVPIARARVPTSFVALGPSIGTVSAVVAPDGGLNLTLSAPIAASTGLFGVACQIPAHLTLSTFNSGGDALTGPLTDARAVVTQTGYSLGPAISTGAGGTCPTFLAGQIDKLLALPTDSTSAVAHISMDIQIP